MLRFLTAGESHGKTLVGTIEGFPSNVPIDMEQINKDLARRQKGYGRGGRMKIETDKMEILAGLRNGKTLGSPIAFLIKNKDYENWGKFMDPEEAEMEEKRVSKPRPGHADLTGALKYGFDDVRNVLERSSARETAVRVGIGSLAKQLMTLFDIEVYSHVIAIGNAALGKNPNENSDEKLGKIIDEKLDAKLDGKIDEKSDEEKEDLEVLKKAEESEVRCIDQDAENAMIEEIKKAKENGESLGGVFEIHIKGVPHGLGSYVQWDRKLDGKLAHHLMSIQGIKGVEIGDGFETAGMEGSKVHDEIYYDEEQKFYRKTNHAGGIEGGMSNGETIVIRCAMKPIPTLYKPLKTVDLITKEEALASVERSDTCAVPAASIVGEMVAITVIAQEFLRKFGGDSIEEIRKRWKDYQ